MSKQVYSLVLSEQVMGLIDREALMKGSNRSQMVNDILCRALGLSTPDIKMNQVMDMMLEALRAHEGMQMVSASHGNTLQLRTTVSYKYKPKLKYVIEMNSKANPLLATLRIYSRTTSEPFLQALVMFFGYLTEFEEQIEATIGHHSVRSSGYVFDDNKFSKRFECDWTASEVSSEAIAAYLSNYIQFLDDGLKLYFEHYGNWRYIDKQMLALYRKYM